MLTRRAFGALLTMTALSTTMGAAFAQEFPSRNIAIVVHTGPGGPFDTLARRMAELLSKELGWRVRVENREGSTGVVALNSVMREPADGHTIIAIGNHTANNIALKRSEFTLDDLEYIGALTGEASALVVPADSPYGTLEDYVAELRAEPDSIRVGGSGTASNAFAHFLLNEAADITSTWVPFETAPEAITTLLGGHLDAVFATPSSVQAQLEGGEFRILALSSAERTALYPDTPTFSEQGYDVDLFLWRGFGVRAGTPPEVVQAWRDAFQTIQADPSWAEMMAAQRQEPYTLVGDDLKAITLQEIDGFARYAEATGT